MHTTDGATNGVSFAHNGDMSGDVWIIIDENAVWPYRDKIYEYEPKESFGDTTIPGKHVLRIPFEDLKRLVAKYVRTELAGKIEYSTDDEILGI